MISRRLVGIAVRDTALTHLKAIAFVMFVLLVVAIAIDLTRFLDDLREKLAAQDLAFVPTFAKYLLYRATDIIAHLLPLACLTGSFVAELLRHQRMEPVILASAGAPPTVFFASMFAVGIAAGSVQVALEVWLRPAAVGVQAQLGIGGYGHRYRPGTLGTYWFVENDIAIIARVVRDDPPELQELRMFSGVGTPALTKVVEARSAKPIDKDLWRLHDAVVWEGQSGSAMLPQSHETLETILPLTQTQVRNHRVAGFVLPNSVLWDIASIEGNSRSSEVETAVMRRFTAIFLPGIFAFLGATLSQCGRNGRFFAWWKLLVLGTLGYIMVVSVKSFWTLSEFEVLTPLVATSLPMLAAFVLASILQVRLNGLPSRS